ncbi:zf-TFIIB domain-containing protein [Dehalococcoidia bacterium]|nr:zf-TFIIB domain-containing protein [Dehalococcoidia bacterium]
MKCPRDDSDLQIEKYKGVEIDRCPTCQGLWLDYPELDALEDTVMNEDKLKGTMIYSPHSAGITCLKCNDEMTAFYYRANDLEIDLCKHGHGFWLDHGEEKRVLEFMKQRIKDLQRSATAEAQWDKFLKSKPGQGLWARIKGFFSGR